MFADPDDPDLHDAIELACLDAMRGDPHGPLLASRLQRACEDALRSRGVAFKAVRATSTAAGTAVHVLLLAPGNTVREVALRLA